MATSTTKRFVGEPVELSRDCELGQEGDRAVVTVLDGHYMTLHFPDRAPDCRDVHTGADYKYLRAYEGAPDTDLTAVSMDVRAKLNAWGTYAAKTMTSAAARRELRDLVATYLEGSDDAPRAAELLDALEPLPLMLSDAFWDRFKAEIQKLADEPLGEREARERAMFGCTEASIDAVLANKEPRDIAMYAMGALSNAQELIQRDGDEPFAWSVRRADANTIRQLMNIAKHAINTAVPQVTATVTKARHGAWTPWAQVLCVECEYAMLKSSSRGDSYARRLKVVTELDRTAEVDCPEGDLLALCNECRCKCWTRDDVALLQQVGFRSSDLDWEGPFGWALQQTGGMCAALVFETDGRQIVVTAMDGEFYIGEYTHVDGEEDSWDRPLRTWQSTSLYEDGVMKDAPTLGVLADECARKVIDFIHNPAPAASSKDVS